jgi:DNA-binding transcriptional ArsR family regulator
MYQYPEEVKLFKALTHPVRLAILEILRGGEQCVCHMEAVLGYRQAYISQQLMVLRDAGLLQDRRDGLNVYYRVIRPEIYAVLDATLQMTEMPAAKLILAPVACTCPNCKEHNTHRIDIPVEFQNRS